MAIDVCARCGAYVYPKYNDICLECGLPLAEPFVHESTESPSTELIDQLKTADRPENIWLALLLVYTLVGLSMAFLVYI